MGSLDGCGRAAARPGHLRAVGGRRPQAVAGQSHPEGLNSCHFMEPTLSFSIPCAVFQTDLERSVTIELWGDFTKMDGIILSIGTPGHVLTLALSANNHTKVCT